MSEPPAHASNASGAGPGSFSPAGRRRADRRDRDRSEVVPVGHESGDDPLVRALVQQDDERDSTPLGASELSQENLAYLLERLDGPLMAPRTMDSAARASVERAFGAPASGQFSVAQPPAGQLTERAADDHASGTPRPGLRSGVVRTRRDSRLQKTALLWSLLAVVLGALAASWEWIVEPPPAENVSPATPSRGSFTPIVEPLTTPAAPVAPQGEDPRDRPPVAEDPAAEGKASAETTRRPASAQPKSRRTPPRARASRKVTLKVTRAAGPARIFLGKRLLGKIPGEVTLPPGRHHLMIRTPDGVSYMRTVRARPGAEVKLTLP